MDLRDQFVCLGAAGLDGDHRSEPVQRLGVARLRVVDSRQLEHQLHLAGQRPESAAQHVDGRAVIGLPRVQTAEIEIGLQVIRL